MFGQNFSTGSFDTEIEYFQKKLEQLREMQKAIPRDLQERDRKNKEVDLRQREGEILMNLGAMYSTVPNKIDAERSLEFYSSAMPIFHEIENWYFYYKSALTW